MINAKKIMDMLEKNGHQARIAGGAVRDIVLNQKPKDIDIATTARPAEVVMIFEAAGYEVIPTGLQHGTVTVVIDHIPYEITTLRIDVDTDGRHATVEFTDDWVQDAARRDFTINAMYMDKDGKIHDYFNGQEDLKQRRIRFVGNPKNRIKEDYLRILRFFRFFARFDGTCSIKTGDVIAAHKDGLKKISKERILMEISKIATQYHDRTYIMMNRLGVSEVIFGKELQRSSKYFENDYGMILHSMGVPSTWFEEVKAPRAVIDKVKFMETFNHENPVDSPFGLNYATMVHGKERMRDYSVLKGLGWEVPDVPKFPLSGHDVIQHWNVSGPDVGELLNILKIEWCASNFTLTGEQLKGMKNVQ